MSEPTRGAALRVVAGSPTPEEVAVVVSVLSAVAASAAPAVEPVRLRGWSNRARALRRRPAPGPTTWRDSGLPL
jgi:Acyl-CoA carboxylase epsilon subunit